MFVALSACSRVQALAQADAVDAKAAAGESIDPLCGLPLAVKDSTDVKGLPTSQGTSALVGEGPLSSLSGARVRSNIRTHCGSRLLPTFWATFPSGVSALDVDRRYQVYDV